MMNYQQLDDAIKILSKFNDDVYWTPFYTNNTLLYEFDEKMQKVIGSQKWTKERNKEKGTVLEDLMEFVFGRFQILSSIHKEKRTADNELDLHIKFNDTIPLNFLQDTKSKFICECKNMGSKKVDVGMVAKLVEICRDKAAGLGIFVSIKGLSGWGWKYGEGKRKKLLLADKIPIISFTLSEIQNLKNPDANFFTMIKNKYSALYDEVDDDSSLIYTRKKTDPEFIPNLLFSLSTFEKFGLITHQEKETIKYRMKQKYGDINIS